jgi:hypothetical protein
MAKPLVCAGAQLLCSFGAAPCALAVTSNATVTTSSMPVATIVDSAPVINIPTFGMCASMTNPQVAAATTAALGVLTPMPCVPVTTPWVPGSPTELIGGKPALTFDSTCMCSYGGKISIINPGQVTTTTK